MRPAWLLVVAAACGGNAATSPHDALVDTSPDAPPTPSMLAIDLPRLGFGSVGVGATSPSSTLTITNTGELATGVVSVALAGADAASFATTGTTCTGSLAPGAHCVVPIAFAPATEGAKAATVTIEASPGGSVTAMLDGTGIPPGVLAIATTANALGDVAVGDIGPTVATFTVTNTGTGSSGAIAVQTSGANPYDFVVDDGCTGHALDVGAACTFDVRFAPRARGARSATFEVTGEFGGFVTGATNGRGLAPARIATAFVHRDFGTVAAGGSTTATVMFANTGEVATGPIAELFVGGSGFVASGGTCANAPLAAGATCTVLVDLAAATTGAKDSSVTVSATPGGARVVTLGGIVTPAGQLAIAPSNVVFADAPIGTNGAAQIFTITNTGASASGTLHTTGASAAFAILADTCDSFSLAPGATCQVTMRFTPALGGPIASRLDITSASAGAVTASVAGVALGGPRLVVSPAALDLGSVALGASVETSLAVQNTGDEVAGVPVISLGGANRAELATTNTCSTTLAPGAVCSIVVRFTPTSVGAKAATLDLIATPGGTLDASLAATAIAAGGLAISPSAFAFADTPVGFTSVAQTFTVHNTGTTPITTLAVTGAPPFVVENACAALLPAGQSCTFRATFAPTVIAPSTGALTATDGSAPASAAVAGLGLPHLEVIAIDSAPAVAPSGHAFAATPVGDTTPVFVTLLDHATQQLLAVGEQYGSPAQFTTVSNDCNSVLRVGGTCTVRLEFAPTSSGTKTGTATFSIGAGTFDSVPFALSGTAP